MRKSIYFTFHCFVLSVLACLIVATGYGLSHGSDYWKARVATAIALSRDSPRSASKPAEMTCLTAAWCGPCGTVKADEKAGKLTPLSIKYCDVDKDRPPIPWSTVPAFYWVNSDGKAWQWPRPETPDNQRGYPGSAKLIEYWRQTQPQGLRPP